MPAKPFAPTTIGVGKVTVTDVVWGLVLVGLVNVPSQRAHLRRSAGSDVIDNRARQDKGRGGVSVRRHRIKRQRRAQAHQAGEIHA